MDCVLRLFCQIISKVKNELSSSMLYDCFRNELCEFVLICHAVSVLRWSEAAWIRFENDHHINCCHDTRCELRSANLSSERLDCHWAAISGTPEISHLQILHKRPLGLKDELIRIWWSKVKATVTARRSHFCEPFISGTPGGNFIASATNIHLDSRMN